MYVLFKRNKLIFGAAAARVVGKGWIIGFPVFQKVTRAKKGDPWWVSASAMQTRFPPP